MLVHLYDNCGTALIIPHPTGVIYSNQAGGHSCMQPEVEGFLVPVANDVGLPEHNLISPENELFAYFSNSGSCGGHISETDAQMIESVFHQLLPWVSLFVDRVRLQDSVESWVYVRIFANRFGPLPVSGISYPVDAILTWCNSD